MPRRNLKVTRAKRQDSELPEWANEYAVTMQWLESRGLLAEVDRRLQVPRRDGYTGLDVFAFLVAYFTSSLKCGLRPFSDRCREHSDKLAALAARKCWPTAASVSRFLSVIEASHSESFTQWLLNEAADSTVLEHSRVVVNRDTRGDEWHWFDWDPTITTLRQRALPAGTDLPEGHRKTDGLAAPGYSGRKRGEVQVSRATLEHAGSGLWTGMWMGPGNGAPRRDNAKAAQSIAQWCERTGQPLQRAVLRSDGGAGGNVPAITTCKEAGVHYLTRLARYGLLQQPDIKAHIAQASWQQVPDSGSGPQRFATELGLVTLHPGDDVVRENGKPYESIQTRVIVSRASAEQARRGAGVVIDGWRYELFATSLPAANWPAAEAVAAYYGRVGQENRFAQEDRELGLDRIFNYELGGQMLANAVGLFVWNFRLSRGAESVGKLPDSLPTQSARDVQMQALVDPMGTAVARPTDSPDNEEHGGTQEPKPAPSVAACSASHDDGMLPSKILTPPQKSEAPMLPSNTPTAEPPDPERQGSPLVRDPHECGFPCGTECSTTEHDDSAEPKPASPPQLPDAADWQKRLASLPGWQWDSEEGLVCPAGHRMKPHDIRKQPSGSLMARFRGNKRECTPCSMRSRCSSSQVSPFRKEICITVQQRGTSVHHSTKWPSDRANANHRHQPPQTRGKKVKSPKTMLWEPTPGANEPGPLAVAGPLLIPSGLRQFYVDNCRQLTIKVSVHLPPSPDPSARRTPYLAYSSASRQHQRKTWSWRRARNRLPSEATVDITIEGVAGLEPILAKIDADSTVSRKAA